MKLIRASKANFQFHLNSGEKQIFFQLLDLYPRIPSGHHSSSRQGSSVPSKESQHLLDEALAEQRADNKDKLQVFLSDPVRFKADNGGWRLSISPSELEWLLQILNDIRVGSWLILGSPVQLPTKPLNEEFAADFWSMEMAGFFQISLIEAQRSRIR